MVVSVFKMLVKLRIVALIDSPAHFQFAMCYNGQKCPKGLRLFLKSSLNSSQIDELGNWCRGAATIRRRGGIHGNPGSGNHPQRQPLTGTVTLKESVETTYLTHTYLDTNHQRGGGGREQEYAKIR